ncbi:MAG: DUF58 domain-containing protein [Deltaproteobacteria bacterium]|nr:DUF58 domain-containing protein [Deltaproteobacteria bacterium]
MAALLALLLISGLFGKRNLSGLDVQIRMPEEIYAGTEFLLPVTLINRKTFLPVFLMRIRIEGAEAFFPYVDPGGQSTRYVPLALADRGPLHVEQLVISSVFPFNFFVRYGRIQKPLEMVVFPKPLRCSLWSLFEREHPSQGDRTMSRRGEGSDILSFRNYLVGDPLKYIDWKASARTGTLKTRELAALSFHPVIIDFDKIQITGLETKLSCLTFVIASLFRKNMPVGLRIRGQLYGPGLSKGHRIQMFRELAFYGKENESSDRH